MSVCGRVRLDLIKTMEGTYDCHSEERQLNCREWRSTPRASRRAERGSADAGVREAPPPLARPGRAPSSASPFALSTRSSCLFSATLTSAGQISPPTLSSRCCTHCCLAGDALSEADNYSFTTLWVSVLRILCLGPNMAHPLPLASVL